MLVNIIRTTIIFITLVIIMRLMGKRQIGEMQPYEFIVTLIIADLACRPMTDVSTPLIYGLVAILALFVIHQVFALLEQGGKFFKKVISGKPSLVINKNGVDLIELKRNNMGVDDLIESIRATGCFSLDQIDYAVFESNGKLSVMQNQNQTEQPKSLPILLVNDGKIDKQNLSLIRLTEKNVQNFINMHRGTLKNTEVITVDGNGRVYFKQRKQKYQILNLSLPEGVQW